MIVYLTIISRVRVGYEMEESQRGPYHLISNKREWNNWFIKNAHKISNSSELICKKTPIFSLFLILRRHAQLPYLESMV